LKKTSPLFSGFSVDFQNIVERDILMATGKPVKVEHLREVKNNHYGIDGHVITEIRAADIDKPGMMTIPMQKNIREKYESATI
jgi:hypothetical protein